MVLLFTGQSTRSSLSAIRYDRQRSRSHEEGGSGIKLLILFSRGCYARDMLKILSMVEATGGISLLNLNFIQRERVSLRRWIFLGGVGGRRWMFVP